MKLYTDAARDPTTGRSAAGCLIIAEKQIQLSQPLIATDNQAAEFLAAIWGFQQLILHFGTGQSVFYFTDSRIVSDSLQKEFAKHYQSELAELTKLQDQCQLVITQWIPEKQNRGAHELSLQGLHSA